LGIDVIHLTLPVTGFSRSTKMVFADAAGTLREWRPWRGCYYV